MATSNPPESTAETTNKEEIVFPIVHSDQDAYKLYCDYAHNKGFSVRKQHLTHRTHTRIVKLREYCCSKAGMKNTKKSPMKYRKSDIRTGCLACITFLADKEGKNWTVSRFVEEHNHPLATEKDNHLLRSRRNVSEMQGSILKNMTAAGIRAVDSYNFISNEIGGVENVGFLKTDAFNYVQRERRALIESGDASSLLNLLQKKHFADNMFSYEVRTDELNRLTSFLWMDGHSKIDYDCFGDVLIFDTTYRLNKYNLACAPFIAVNHHWQNVFLGGAFIAEETIESFCWVFESFLSCVCGKQPITIFTDQDQAMAIAIERVLTTTRHRLCQWHICKKAPSKVPTFNNDRNVRNCFYNCMSKCDGEEEFNRYWNEMITTGGLHDNRWLGDLYAIRRRWSTTFNKDVLDLGILSTQRSESANNCLHGCSKTTSSIVECFSGMEKLVASWRRNERDEDFKCTHSAVSLRFKMSLLLKHMSKQYTRKMFAIFEKTFMEAVLGVNVVDEERYNDGDILYITTQSDSVDVDKRWFVSYNSTSSTAQCSCRGFETKGILCRHILRIYNLRNARQIPSIYILKRFTVNARHGIYLPDTPSLTDHESNLIFRNHLMRFSYDLARQVENSKIAKDHVVSAMNALSLKVGSLIDNDKQCAKACFDESERRKIAVNDPPMKRPKGAPNGRMKDHWERGKRKSKPRCKAECKGKSIISDEKSTTKEFDFFGSHDTEQQTSPPHTPAFDDSHDDDFVNMSFNFSSVPDVFKPF